MRIKRGKVKEQPYKERSETTLQLQYIPCIVCFSFTGFSLLITNFVIFNKPKINFNQYVSDNEKMLAIVTSAVRQMDQRRESALDNC